VPQRAIGAIKPIASLPTKTNYCIKDQNNQLVAELPGDVTVISECCEYTGGRARKIKGWSRRKNEKSS
jgi:hypothetical protein